MECRYPGGGFKTVRSRQRMSIPPGEVRVPVGRKRAKAAGEEARKILTDGGSKMESQLQTHIRHRSRKFLDSRS